MENTKMNFDDKLIHPKAQEELERAIQSSINEPYREIFLKDLQEHLKNTDRYIENCIRAHDEHMKHNLSSYFPKRNLDYWMVGIDGKITEELAYGWVHAGILQEQTPPVYLNQEFKKGTIPRPEDLNKEMIN